ncbi:transposase [Paenibacillus phyllosphaerae]|uniref:transposase n=1 Tax=Paenibacillus phyllosphaerae TaxID=274593 RepID=UPI00160DC583
MRTLTLNPRIGNKIAATALSEVGEIERFDNSKKLVAFAGLDPGVFSVTRR